MDPSLEEIRACLNDERPTPRCILELRLAATREQVAVLEREADQLNDVLLTTAVSNAERVFDSWVATMLTLARRWEELARQTYCHDEGLRCNMAATASQVPGLAERFGADRALLRYVGQALASALG